jgi:hypothetical protein
MTPVTARRLTAIGLVVVGAASACSGNAASHRGTATPPVRTVITTGEEGWRLTAPVSRLVAFPDGAGVVLAGGLTTGGTSSTGVYRLNPTTGSLRFLAAMPSAFHDAAGAVIAGRDVVFGGGSASSFDLVQSYAGGRSGTVVGHLPTPRSDLSAVTVAGRTYLVGGYTGHAPSPAVLATSDGRSFTTVAHLMQPVRYAAVAALGHDIWIFGGIRGNRPVRTIQRVDVGTGRATIAGSLPAAVSDATAFVVGGKLLIAGGRDAAGRPTATVLDFSPVTGRAQPTAHLPHPVADSAGAVIGSTAYLIGGEVGPATGGTPVRTVQTISVTRVTPSPSPARSSASAGPGPGAPAALSDQHPFNGQLLIADRGNNRLLVVNADKQILWTFPTASRPAPPTGFYFPDDAFFIHHGTGIISNQEGNDTVVEVGYPSGAPLWSYGHPRIAKAKPGYLHEPDDAYLLRDGRVVVADANNCRVVVISPAGHQVEQIGRPGNCTHNPPADLGYPNGDTPLADGNILISEVIGSWISEYTLAGHLVWTVQLPSVRYPSDPQQIGPDRYLVADYSKPGGLVEFDRSGHILWRYQPRHGDAMLNHPSLAEVLPGGFICTNDDYRDRVVIIDPATKRIVWQYGHTSRRGTRPGYLHIPDGFDLLEPDGTTPTHPFTG